MSRSLVNIVFSMLGPCTAKLRKTKELIRMVPMMTPTIKMIKPKLSRSRGCRSINVASISPIILCFLAKNKSRTRLAVV